MMLFRGYIRLEGYKNQFYRISFFNEIKPLIFIYKKIVWFTHYTYIIYLPIRKHTYVKVINKKMLNSCQKCKKTLLNKLNNTHMKTRFVYQIIISVYNYIIWLNNKITSIKIKIINRRWF